MVTKKRIAIVGYGRVGSAAIDAIKASPDMELAGVIRRASSIREQPSELRDIPVTSSLDDLGEVHAAILCVPSRAVPNIAPEYLARGINTVDSFDIHGEELIRLRADLHKAARKGNSVAIVSAGWDPGSDSLIRGLLEAMAPVGITYVNFGPGMSLGHTVAAKSIEGVKDALSLTIPMGYGVHKRIVYVELKEGADSQEVEDKIRNDPYFVKDETTVQLVGDVSQLVDMGHGVNIERWGCSGRAHNQWFRFSMRVNNPALTAQVMVAAARASFKQEPGAYTLLEIPVIDLLIGEKVDLIRRLV
jgi:diaminopimelate dehydrogenase